MRQLLPIQGRDHRLGGADPVPPGKWHTAGTTGEPNLENGWEGNLRFRRTNENQTEIQADISGGEYGTVVTLPAVYRPDDDLPPVLGAEGLWTLQSDGQLVLAAGAITQDTLDSYVPRIAVKDDGSTVGTRHGINFHEGSNVTLTISDDPGNDEVDVTIAASGGGGGGIGMPELIYRYTVTGSDKASIDTGVDSPAAGSNDWTGGDVLEIWLIARTDESTTRSSILLTFNNDTGANYDEEQFRGLGTGVAAAGTVAQNNMPMEAPGASASANYAASMRGSVPGYAATTFYKTAEFTTGYNHATAGSNFASNYAFSWRNTAAITRLAVACTSSNKLKVGSALYIYKRLDA